MNKPNRSRFLAVVALMLGIATSASAAFFIVTPPRTVLPTLRTYNQAAADWWRWELAQPTDVNPMLDRTGEHCAQGQPAFGVWYLASAPDSEQVTRSCTVPALRTLLIPVINTVYGAERGDRDRSEESVREQTRYIQEATSLTLSIDGVEVRNVQSYYEESTLFSVTLREGNILGMPAGTVLSPSADAGYYVAVSGLLPGNHTISWHGEVGEYEQNVTYRIKISGL